MKIVTDQENQDKFISHNIQIIKEINRFTSDQKKSWWGEGEWVDELDEVDFIYKDYECRIRRIYVGEHYSKEFHVFGGYLCGYVKVSDDHVCYGKDYNDIEIDVHGSLTYSGLESETKSYWIGFDCAHSGDFVPSMEYFKKKSKLYKEIENILPIPKELKKYSIFNPFYRNINYCVEECKSVVDQLVNISKKETAE